MTPVNVFNRSLIRYALCEAERSLGSVGRRFACVTEAALPVSHGDVPATTEAAELPTQSSDARLRCRELQKATFAEAAAGSPD